MNYFFKFIQARALPSMKMEKIYWLVFIFLCQIIVFKPVKIEAKALEQLTTTELIRLASRMVGSGRIEKSLEVIEETKLRLTNSWQTETDPDILGDHFELKMIEGALALKIKNYIEAETSFFEAVNIASKNEGSRRISLLEASSYFVKSLFQNEKYRESIEYFESSSLLGAHLYRDFSLFYAVTESYKSLGMYRQCASVLLSSDYVGVALRSENVTGEASKTGESDHYGILPVEANASQLSSEEVMMFIEHSVRLLSALELKSLSFDVASHALRMKGIESEDFGGVLSAVSESLGEKKLTEYFELANILRPDHLDFKYSLARMYLKEGRLRSAEGILTQLYRSSGKYTFELAQIHLQLGNITQAKFYNMQVSNSKDKISQRLAIFLEEENYERIAAFETEASRYGLLEKDEYRYLMGYALMKTGDFKGAENRLSEVTSASLISRVVEIRKNLKECKVNSWQCIN